MLRVSCPVAEPIVPELSEYSVSTAGVADEVPVVT